MYRKHHAKQFIFAHININGFRSKYHEIQDILMNGSLDFIAVSETKIDDSFPSSQFHVPNFSLYRSDRNSRGGGILCYVLSAIPHRRRNDIMCAASLVEHVILELKVHKKTIYIAALYRPPSVSIQNLCDAIESLCNECLAQNSCLYIIGDLNVDFSNEAHSLSDVLSVNAIQNIVKEPTCFKSQTNPSIIDVILTNTPRKLYPCINLNTGLSDCHNLIGAATKMHIARNCDKIIKYRSYKNFDVDAYKNDLSIAPFHVSCIFDDPDDALWAHNTLLMPILNEHAPLKSKIARRQSLPCMNGELRRAINVKAMLRRKYDRNRRDDVAWERYRCQRNKVNRLKAQSISRYFQERCSSSARSRRQFWKTIRPFISDSRSPAGEITLVEEDRVVSNSSAVGEILNELFTNTATNNSENLDVGDFTIEDIATHYQDHPSIKIIQEIMTQNPQEMMNFHPVTQGDVLKKINKLKINKACGYDAIPAKLLKAGSEQISRFLTPIVNMTLSSSSFPDIMKHAEVSPAHKKLDPTDKRNYRPISVLASMSKVFEGILCDQLMNYFSNILSMMLSAYRQNYSCCNVVLKCIEDWKAALDKDEVVGCILMDLSKAFDSLPHALLLAKLRSYGLSDNSCQLIKTYLTNRQQRVKIGTERSTWRELKRGVPQGSLTGPLLFNIFLNDLLHDISDICTVYNYADDNSLSFHHSDPTVVKSVLESASMQALEWFSNNFMLANPDKFQAITLTRSSENPINNFKIGDASIEPSTEVKMLGFIVDDKLTFKKHVQTICSKAARQVNALRRISNYLSIDSKLAIYDCFIKANFNYGAFIYHFSGKNESRMLEKVHEKAIRVVFNDFNSPYVQHLNNQEKESLYDQRLKSVIYMIFKIMSNEAPPLNSDFFKLIDVPYNFRSPMLSQEMYNTQTYGFNSMRISGASLWNKLPSNVKCCDLVNIKETLRSHNFTCNCGHCLRCTM
jgi:hypothetical protein